MAWYLWVDDDKVGANCSDLSTLTEKSAGFQGGQAAIAKNVNVALRQANLVACALMDVIDSQSALSYSNSRQQITNQFTAYFNKFATKSEVTDGMLISNKAILLCSSNGDVKITAESNDEYILPHTEAGVAKFKLGSGNFKFVEIWAESFKGNADSATNATNATYAEYASSDTSKGTIEERLTNLGFKYLPVTISRQITITSGGKSATIGTLLIQPGRHDPPNGDTSYPSYTTREGNRVHLAINLQMNAYNGLAGNSALDAFYFDLQEVTLPSVLNDSLKQFRPKYKQVFTSWVQVYMTYNHTVGSVSSSAGTTRNWFRIEVTLQTNGDITLQCFGSKVTSGSAAMYLYSYNVQAYNVENHSIGYQANPIE